MDAKWRVAALGALAFMGVSVVSVEAQVIRGRVLDDATEIPVSGVLVIVSQGAAPRGHAVSGDDGVFVFRADSPGGYSIRAVRLGYRETVIPELDLASSETVVDFDLLMTPRPVALEGLVVSAARYQSDIESLGLRAEDLGRRLMTRDELSGMGFRDLGSVLERRALPGIRTTRGENISAMEGGSLIAQRIPFCVRMDRARRIDGSVRCALVILDQAVASQEAVDALTPEDLEAVVVLTPTEAAQRFGTMGGSGVVLLYSRRAR